jgi:endoglucanase
MTIDTTDTPQIGEEQINLLERLSNAVAVSGDEGEVRRIVLEAIAGRAEVKVDALGNVLAQAPAQTPGLRVMVAAHMDEIGFMLTGDDDDGLFRFDPVGGMDTRQAAGKALWVGKNHVPGVIGLKILHLASADERKQVPGFDSLRIDLGPGNAGKAKIGDRAAYATTLTRLGSGPQASLLGKALDNRLGVATLIELVRNPPPNIHLLAAFTVQEEVGLRGAAVAAYALAPDAAIALDSTPANDLPAWDGSENIRYNTRLGAGPAIYIGDGATLSDPRLVRHLMQTGEALGIPYQVRQPGGGGTDAGSIHKSRAGVPTVSVSIPSRYAHTAALLCRLNDWQHTLALLYHALGRLEPALLAEPRP